MGFCPHLSKIYRNKEEGLFGTPSLRQETSRSKLVSYISFQIGFSEYSDNKIDFDERQTSTNAAFEVKYKNKVEFEIAYKDTVGLFEVTDPATTFEDIMPKIADFFLK